MGPVPYFVMHIYIAHSEIFYVQYYTCKQTGQLFLIRLLNYWSAMCVTNSEYNFFTKNEAKLLEIFWMNLWYDFVEIRIKTWYYYIRHKL